MRSRLLTIVVLGLLPVAATGKEPTFPAPPDGVTTFLRDEPGVLEESLREAINRAAAALQADEQVSLFVVVIGSLAARDARGFSIERYAQLLYQRWQVGSRSGNRGVLFLVSLGDRRVRLELGPAWDRRGRERARRLTSERIVPAFESGAYGEGIRVGVDGIASLVRGEDLARLPLPWWVRPVCLLGAVGILLVVFSLLRSGTAGLGWWVLTALGLVVAFLLGLSSTATRGGPPSGAGGAGGFWTKRRP
jgi:uncharacterized protein